MRVTTTMPPMSDGDDRPARSFDGVADAYQRARPSYPAAAVGWVLERAPGRRVVDLAAGTGKLTQVLVAAGAEVTAVEPLPNMRARSSARSPACRRSTVRPRRSRSRSGSADAVLVAQAFHWFEADRALREIARVLVPGGVLGLLWNRAMSGCRGWPLSRPPCTAPATCSPGRASSLRAAARSGLHPLERREFPNPVPFDRARLVEWATSTSSIATLAPAKREAALAASAASPTSTPTWAAGRRSRCRT